MLAVRKLSSKGETFTSWGLKSSQQLSGGVGGLLVYFAFCFVNFHFPVVKVNFVYCQDRICEFKMYCKLLFNNQKLICLTTKISPGQEKQICRHQNQKWLILSGAQKEVTWLLRAPHTSDKRAEHWQIASVRIWCNFGKEKLCPCRFSLSYQVVRENVCSRHLNWYILYKMFNEYKAPEDLLEFKVVLHCECETPLQTW